MNHLNPILTTSEIRVGYKSTLPKLAVDNVKLELYSKEILAITGESGCGKTTLVKTIINLISDKAHAQGELTYTTKSGHVIELNLSQEDSFEDIRGNEIGMVFQEPAIHLNPTLTCGEQILESYFQKNNSNVAEGKQAILQELALVGFSDPMRIFDSYPNQVSGGECQRVMLVMSAIQRPQVLLTDEPTASVDVSNRRFVLDYLQTLRHEHSMSIVVVTHDLDIALNLSDRIAIMKNGKIVETIATAAFTTSHQDPYTKYLFGQWHKLAEGNVKGEEHNKTHPEQILQVKDLYVNHVAHDSRSLFGKHTFTAVKGVGFNLCKGETLGILGASGSGKTSLAHCLAGLIEPHKGNVKYIVREGSCKTVQLVFQHPGRSLSPSQTVGDGLKEVIKVGNKCIRPEEIIQKANDLMNHVSLPLDLLESLPTALSGGEKQRVCVARVLAADPELIIFDEATTALDAPIKTEVLELLLSLKRKLNLTYIFISHDFSVIRFVADSVIVMHEGEIIEKDSITNIIHQPKHGITKQLTTQNMAHSILKEPPHKLYGEEKTKIPPKEH